MFSNDTIIGLLLLGVCGYLMGSEMSGQLLPTPPAPVRPNEIHQKMSKLHQLIAAMDRLLEKDQFTVQEALELQHLRQQRDNLMKTLPRIRKVVDNT